MSATDPMTTTDLTSVAEARRRQDRLEAGLETLVTRAITEWLAEVRNLVMTEKAGVTAGQVYGLWDQITLDDSDLLSADAQGVADEMLRNSSLPDEVFTTIQAVLSAWMTSDRSTRALAWAVADALSLDSASLTPTPVPLEPSITAASRRVQSDVATQFWEELTAIGQRWRDRAVTIAKTTATRVNGSETWAALLADGVPYKTWISHHDERTRDTHREADGQTVPTELFFSVGGAGLSYPGDPLGPIEEWIQCRCVMTGSYSAGS